MNRKLVFICLGALLVAILAPGIHALMMIPSEVTQFEGEEQSLDFGLPWGVQIKDTNGILKLADEVGEGVVLQTNESGNYDFTFNLLGLIPLKRMQVNVIPQVKLVPSGHSIGVKVSDYGVMVAGLDSVLTSAGRVEPAKDSGFEVGDILLTVNDTKLTSLEHAAAVLEKESQPGKELTCEVLRQGSTHVLKITPVYDEESSKKRLGLLLRDTAAGVGTMTFYHPETGIYGALGHMITDEQGGKALDLSSGSIVDADIISIQPGQKGKPGEKKGTFNDVAPLGFIDTNTELGIYGRLARTPEAEVEALPLGFKHQVQTGEAEILTVVEGDKIERFSIEIEKVFIQGGPASKGMVLRITDPRLLEATGGIVQGMSGSPIIQNGKLVGAVTHVFINEPNRGYGCFAEWMVMESGLLEEIESIVPPELLEAYFFCFKQEKYTSS